MSNNDMVRINIKSDVRKLHCKAQELRMLRTITNEILTNCSYSEHNREQQEERFDKFNVPEKHREVMYQAWELKYLLGIQLMSDLKELIDKYYIKTKELKETLQPKEKKSIDAITTKYRKEILDTCFNELKDNK